MLFAFDGPGAARSTQVDEPVTRTCYVPLPGCAHVPQLQAPQQFLAAIRDFVSR